MGKNHLKEDLSNQYRLPNDEFIVKITSNDTNRTCPESVSRRDRRVGNFDLQSPPGKNCFKILIYISKCSERIKFFIY